MEVWLLNKLSLLVPNICIENSMENMPTYVGVTRVKKKSVFKSEYTLHSNLFFQQFYKILLHWPGTLFN